MILEVRVRYLDERLVQLIDEKANLRGLSRNEFLKVYLGMLHDSSVLKHEENKLEDLLILIYEGVEFNYRRLQSLEEGFEKLFYLILFATDVQPNEVDLILADYGFNKR